MDKKIRDRYRDEVVKSIERDLVGPAEGEHEVVKGQIFNRYLSSMLFPANLSSGRLDQTDEPEVEATDDEQGGGDNSLSMAYEALPASMGISFFVKSAKRLTVFAEAGRYQSGHANRGDKSETANAEVSEDAFAAQEPIGSEEAEIWSRQPLGSQEKPSVVSFDVPAVGKHLKTNSKTLDDYATIHAVFRPREDGHLVTVTMLNPQMVDEGKHSKEYAEATLFQCRFRVVAEGGAIGEYPIVNRLSMHEEDEKLRFVYRNRKTFGIGHGCAATWNPSAVEFVQELEANPLPKLKVRGLTNDIDMPAEAQVGLNLRWLADPTRSPKDYRQAFEAFLVAYQDWISRQKTAAEEFEGNDRKTALAIVDKQEEAAARMTTGLECICAGGYNPNFEAFRLAQRAMLEQFLWSDQARKGPYKLGEAPTKSIEPLGIPEEGAPAWRPFQLAFQLLSLESIANEMSNDRETMDLLWFPTGGGKTEAYLALTAFEIARRRMLYHESGGGTSVWMRYTLRLLTSQQFERCATLVSVLEAMRTSDEFKDALGREPITLGLWVGADTAPNHLDKDSDRSPGARQLFERMLEEQEPQNRFQLTSCPRCGTLIVPREKSPAKHYGVEVTSERFRVFCPDSRCKLHSRIPVSVVDEDLYRSPPTVLIGTIDKFAQMVWKSASKAFLGYGGVLVDGAREDVMPPTLIVQDELHLINGPLGTIAGVYEAALDTAIKHKGLERGPKYLAATATIQRASEQVKSLYGRGVLVFPPSGLDMEDSYFSKEDKEEPGRLYIGAMNNGLYSTITTLVQASGACAQAVRRLEKGDANSRNDEIAVDSYWTQVVYHNSRQELGKTTTMLRDDVAVRLQVIEHDKAKRRPFDIVEELSANLKGAEVSKALDNLSVAWPSPNAIDAVPCTNMISVGVDISRLGLMIVKGQPKSTAEYIQASSRVGRDRKRPGGIVLTLFAATRPRDRSHFETFQSYHQALYRLVEPATVTPFASPALDRTLHAALVLAIRQSLEWSEPKDAGRFMKSDPQVKAVIEILRNRLKQACLTGQEAEKKETMERLQQLIDIWDELAEKNRNSLRFDQMRQFEHLLAHHPAARDRMRPPWPTLDSMRHVDGETRIQVLGEYEK